MVNEPTTAYTEVQIDEDSISLTLITESQDGVTIEDTARYTFDELQSLSGQHFTLSLSGDSQSALSELSRLSNIGRIFDESERQIEEGDVLEDDNPAPWSNDTRIVVEEVTDTPADRYIIEGETEGLSIHPDSQQWSEKSVADANPSYPDDDRVILGHYSASTKTYAFPESRLVDPSNRNA
jgi:hypothetical protein